MKGYEDYYFEVRNSRGKLQATFQRRWEAETYKEIHKDCTLYRISLDEDSAGNAEERMKMAMTKNDILEYRNIQGSEGAISLLLLIGKDGYDGTDYDDLLASLEAETHNLND